MSYISNTRRMQAGSLGAIVERLNWTVAKVSRLRLSLDELEIDLIQIRQQCENVIRTHPPVASVDKAHDKCSDAPKSQSHQPRMAKMPPGPVSLQGWSRKLGRSKIGTKQNRAFDPPCPPINSFPFPKDIGLSFYPPDLKHEGNDWFVLFNPSPKVKRILDVNLVHNLAPKSRVFSVRFSRDGKWLATGGMGTAQMYDVKTGVEICVFDHTQTVYIWSVSFSPDGKYLATGGDDKQMRIWNIAEKQIHSTFEGHQASIYSLDFSPNGQFIVSGSHDGSVRIWDIHRGVFKVLTIEDHYLLDKHHGVRSLAISPDGRYVAVGNRDKVLSIWEVPTGVLVHRLRGHRDAVSSVAFTPDGKGLISGSWDYTLKYWDMSALDIGSAVGAAFTSISSTSSSHCLMNLTGHTDSVTSIALSHDGIWVVSGCYDGKVLFWEMRTGVAQYMLATHEDFASQADLSPVENILATVDGDGRTMIWSYGIPG